MPTGGAAPRALACPALKARDKRTVRAGGPVRPPAPPATRSGLDAITGRGLGGSDGGAAELERQRCLTRAGETWPRQARAGGTRPRHNRLTGKRAQRSRDRAVRSEPPRRAATADARVQEAAQAAAARSVAAAEQIPAAGRPGRRGAGRNPVPSVRSEPDWRSRDRVIT